MRGAEVVRAVVIDASIAVKWVLDEPGSPDAAALLARPIRFIAPRLMPIEVAAAVRRRVADGLLRTGVGATAVTALLDAVRRGIVQLADDETLVAEACLLAVSLSHRVPNCLYLALAEREGTSLATADVKLGRLAAERRVPVIALGAASR